MLSVTLKNMLSGNHVHIYLFTHTHLSVLFYILYDLYYIYKFLISFAMRRIARSPCYRAYMTSVMNIVIKTDKLITLILFVKLKTILVLSNWNSCNSVRSRNIKYDYLECNAHRSPILNGTYGAHFDKAKDV